MNIQNGATLIIGGTGHNAYLSDGVQQALGRKPKDFRDFVRDAAVAGAWQS